MSFVPPASQIGDPPWEIARLFPLQGAWSEDDYLLLDYRRGVEFVEGRVEVVPMPTRLHQLIVGYLYRLLFQHLAANNAGQVYVAGYRVRTLSARYREPDLVVILADNEEQAGEQFASAADLVVEVVSPDDPVRDIRTKRAEYAQADIPEYWIVDPRDQSITVLTLPRGKSEYVEAGRYVSGQQAESVLLAGLRVDVAETFLQA